MLRRSLPALLPCLVALGALSACYLRKPAAPPNNRAAKTTDATPPPASDAAVVDLAPDPEPPPPPPPPRAAPARPRDLTVGEAQLGPLEATTTVDEPTLTRLFPDYHVGRGTYFVAGVEGEKLIVAQGKIAVLEVYPDREGNYTVWILHRRVTTPGGVKVGDRYRTVERRLRQQLSCRAGADDWYKFQLCSAPESALRYVFPNTRGPLRNKRLVAVIWTAPAR